MKKVINNILLFSLFIMSLSILFGTYLYSFHENPASEIFNSPLPTDKLEYHAGEVVYVTFDYCRYTIVPVTRYITFVDGLAYNVPPITVTGGKIGCHVLKTGVAIIPKSLPPGKYHLLGKSEFKVNFLATRYTEWYSQDFIVIK